VNKPDLPDQVNPPARHPVLEVSGFSLKFSRAAHVPNLV
jgi:peptide/nickel transport system ATP-binding protein